MNAPFVADIGYFLICNQDKLSGLRDLCGSIHWIPNVYVCIHLSGSQQGEENSRMYNEMVLLKLVQSMSRMLANPPEPFRAEILAHQRQCADKLCRRLESWAALSATTSDEATPTAPVASPPDFPLIPASRGFCLTLRSSLETFRAALRRHDITVPPSTL